MKIKVSDVWAEVEKVAGENPDFIYDASETGCKYVKDSNPSCLVGQALFRLGVPIDLLKMYDGFADSGAGTVLYEDLYERDDPDAVGKCAVAQNEQDSGASWGTAVHRAKKAMKLMQESED